MSINSIHYGDTTHMGNQYENTDEMMINTNADDDKRKVEARRRIEIMRELKESGLTLEEAKEFGIIH